LDDAYKNYEKNINDGIQNPNDIKWDITEPKNPKLYPLTKEEFIDRIKTNSEFSERWGLMIEERELSRLERISIAIEKKLTHKTAHLTKDFDYQKWCDEQNIPTKLITITYNNETIESYE
jgi:hypothetical protein